MATRGTDWMGSAAVARRICQFADQPARVMGVGDSLISSSYSASDTTNTALIYGIVNTWEPPEISGWFCLSLSQGDAYAYYSFYATATNYTPGTALPDALGTNLIPIPCGYTEFASNLANGSLVSRQFIEATVVSPRYFDAGWEQQDVAMTARVVYLRHAAGADMTALGVRPDPSTVEDTKQLNMAGASSIEFLDLALSATGTDTNPGAQLTARTGVDETGTNLIHVGTRIFVNSKSGFEFMAGGIGGTSCAAHAGTTLYSDAALAQLLAASESNTFMICLGANLGLGGSKATYKTNFSAVIDRYRAAALTAGITSPMFLIFAPWYNAQVTDVDIDLMNEALFEIASARSDTLAINLAIQLGDTTSLRVDAIHMKKAGSDAAALALWDVMISASEYFGGGGDFGSRRLLKLGVI